MKKPSHHPDATVIYRNIAWHALYSCPLAETLISLVIDYLDKEEEANSVITYIFTSTSDWVFIQPYLDIQLLWNIVKCKFKSYSPNDYIGKGTVYLLLPTLARRMIWAHRNKIQLFSHLGFGRRRLRICQSWVQDELENELIQKIQNRNRNGTYRKKF